MFGCESQLQNPGIFQNFLSLVGPHPLILLLPPVPLDTLLQLYPGSAETVEGTADGKVDLALTQLLDHLQVLEVAAAARVCHGDAAPLGQLRDELLVHSTLQAFVVGCVNQKLGAVRLEGLYRVFRLM